MAETARFIPSLRDKASCATQPVNIQVAAAVYPTIKRSHTRILGTATRTPIIKYTRAPQWERSPRREGETLAYINHNPKTPRNMHFEINLIETY